MTRRRAFVAAGVAVGAAWGPRVPAAAARGSVGLCPRRAAAYRALVTVLQEAPDGRFRCASAQLATRDFARWYGRQDAGVRAHVDAVLDALAFGPRRSYARLARAGSGDGDAVVAAAVGLVLVACDPPPEADERPVAPALAVPA